MKCQDNRLEQAGRHRGVILGRRSDTMHVNSLKREKYCAGVKGWVRSRAHRKPRKETERKGGRAPCRNKINFHAGKPKGNHHFPPGSAIYMVFQFSSSCSVASRAL